MKMRLTVLGLALFCLLVSSSLAYAGDDTKTGKTIVPSSEKDKARELKLEGPSESTGIEAVELIATMSLAGEFEGTEHHMLRVRKITVAPGGQVAVHQHDSRPGAAYLLEGEMVEHRQGTDGPMLRKAGDAAMEKTGTVHWWKNESDAKAVAIVVDIVPEGTE